MYLIYSHRYAIDYSVKPSKFYNRNVIFKVSECVCVCRGVRVRVCRGVCVCLLMSVLMCFNVFQCVYFWSNAFLNVFQCISSVSMYLVMCFNMCLRVPTCTYQCVI